MRNASIILSSISLLISFFDLIIFIKDKKSKSKNCKTEGAYKRCQWDTLSEEEKELLNLD